MAEIALAAAVVLLPAPGLGAPACAPLERWLEGQGPGGRAPGECVVHVSPDGTVCRWDFAYRDAAARSVFDAMSQRLGDCAGPDGIVTDDQPVNHPDTYDLRRFAFAGMDMALSLKDKAALDKSLIFLRVSAAEAQ